MQKERELSFVERIIISAATGAATGAISGSVNLPDENREEFTSVMIDLALRSAERNKQKQKKGYF